MCYLPKCFSYFCLPTGMPIINENRSLEIDQSINQSINQYQCIIDCNLGDIGCYWSNVTTQIWKDEVCGYRFIVVIESGQLGYPWSEVGIWKQLGIYGKYVMFIMSSEHGTKKNLHP